MAKGVRLALCAVLATSLLLLTSAHPIYWVQRYSRTCTDHPVLGQRYKAHSVVLNTSVLFTVTNGGAALTRLCPGYRYTVQVGFEGDNRQGLLTASQGTLGSPFNAACPNRELLDAAPFTDYSVADVYTTSLSLPCTAKGTVVLKVSSASSSYSTIQQSSATFAVKPACAATLCKATPQNSPLPPSPPVPPSPPPILAPPSKGNGGGDGGDGGDGEVEHEGGDGGEYGQRSPPPFRVTVKGPSPRKAPNPKQLKSPNSSPRKSPNPK